VPSFQAFNTAVSQQFGIDLSPQLGAGLRSAGVLPIALIMGILAWGVTGITALGLNERAVYANDLASRSRCLARACMSISLAHRVMRGVELGVIHDIRSDVRRSAMPVRPHDRARGRSSSSNWSGRKLAATSSDRSLGRVHPSEQSYLIASGSQRQQTFQIADADFAGRLTGSA